MGLFDTILGKKQAPAPPATPAVPKVNKKILIVEDDAYLRDFYVELLKAEGFTVVTADNGQSGLEVLINEKPNLVMTDLMMPVRDGKQLLHDIRQIPEFNQLPVIVLTNAGTVDNITEIKYYNHASEFLIKTDIQPDEIIAKINKLI